MANRVGKFFCDFLFNDFPPSKKIYGNNHIVVLRNKEFLMQGSKKLLAIKFRERYGVVTIASFNSGDFNRDTRRTIEEDWQSLSSKKKENIFFVDAPMHPNISGAKVEAFLPNPERAAVIINYNIGNPILYVNRFPTLQSPIDSKSFNIFKLPPEAPDRGRTNNPGTFSAEVLADSRTKSIEDILKEIFHYYEDNTTILPGFYVQKLLGDDFKIKEFKDLFPEYSKLLEDTSTYEYLKVKAKGKNIEMIENAITALNTYYSYNRYSFNFVAGYQDYRKYDNKYFFLAPKTQYDSKIQEWASYAKLNINTMSETF